MRDTEIKQLRDQDLYETYKRVLREGQFSSMREAADYARLQPASQFYISAREAASHIGKILSCKSLIDLNLQSRRKVWQLYEMYEQYLREHPDNTLSRERILELLVACPAPEFYLSVDRAKHIIVYEQRKVRQKR